MDVYDSLAVPNFLLVIPVKHQRAIGMDSHELTVQLKSWVADQGVTSGFGIHQRTRHLAEVIPAQEYKVAPSVVGQQIQAPVHGSGGSVKQFGRDG
ncbi:MAG: hypothetical protein F4187_00465 [Gemmatimonadetes bacterium]|nr:hypothetical protein [Gemmatimonadota bacterium]